MRVYVTNTGSATRLEDRDDAPTRSRRPSPSAGPLGSTSVRTAAGLFVANRSESDRVGDRRDVDSVLREPSGRHERPILPSDVSAQSATRVYRGARDEVALGHAAQARSVQLLNAADGAISGSCPTSRGGLRARLVGNADLRHWTGTSAPLARICRRRQRRRHDRQVSYLASSWTAAAVVTDPCAFEATATTTVFGPSGGSGTFTIPAPAGCAWTIDPTGFPALSVAAPLSGTGPAHARRSPWRQRPRQAGNARHRAAGDRPRTDDPADERRVRAGATDAGAVRDRRVGVRRERVQRRHPRFPARASISCTCGPIPPAAPRRFSSALASYGPSRPDVAAIYGDQISVERLQYRRGNLPSGALHARRSSRTARGPTRSATRRRSHVTVVQAPRKSSSMRRPQAP